MLHITEEQLANIVAQATAGALAKASAFATNEEIANVVADDVADEDEDDDLIVEKFSPRKAALALAKKYKALRKKGYAKSDITVRVCRAAGKCGCVGGKVVGNKQRGKPFDDCAPARFISAEAKRLHRHLEKRDIPCKY